MYAPACMNTCESLCVCGWEVGAMLQRAQLALPPSAFSSFPSIHCLFFSQRESEDDWLTDWLLDWLTDWLGDSLQMRQPGNISENSCTPDARCCLPTKPESFYSMNSVLPSYRCIFWIQRNLLKADPIKSRRSPVKVTVLFRTQEEKWQPWSFGPGLLLSVDALPLTIWAVTAHSSSPEINCRSFLINWANYGGVLIISSCLKIGNSAVVSFTAGPPKGNWFHFFEFG